MKNIILKLPDTNWVIVKSPKALNKGDWYVVRHIHAPNYVGKAVVYHATSGDGLATYHCAWCHEPVPDVVQGFRNLCEWSEV